MPGQERYLEHDHQATKNQAIKPGELTERLTLRFLMSYDIAPTQDVLAIRLDPEAKQRTLDTLRWDLIPHRAKRSESRVQDDLRPHGDCLYLSLVPARIQET
jgi:putative SOS response-associated peptidase YedK